MYYPADLKWAIPGWSLPARSLLARQISYLYLACLDLTRFGIFKNDTCLSRTVQHREL